MFNRALIYLIFYTLLSISSLHGSFCLATQQTPLLLTPDTLGPITKNTPYDLKVIKQLFPDLEVRKEFSGTEGEIFEVIVVYQHQKPLMTIIPIKQANQQTKLLCVSFSTNAIKNSLGAVIGSSYSNIYKHPAQTKCLAGLEEMSGFIVCSAPHAKNIHYVFQGKWNGPDGIVPPLAILKNWKLKQIIWFASEQYPLEYNQVCRAIANNT